MLHTFAIRRTETFITDAKSEMTWLGEGKVLGSGAVTLSRSVSLCI